MSKQNKLLTYLQSGRTVTSKQIVSSFGLKNPHDAIYKLRSKGFCIYSNRTSDETVKYRIGTPSKRMVAVANRVLGPSVFQA